SHMIDCQLFDLKAGGHHFTNVLLHTIAAVLLFFFFRNATGSGRTSTIWSSAFVTALFAIHPLHVESVAWLAERNDVLGALVVDHHVCSARGLHRFDRAITFRLATPKRACQLRHLHLANDLAGGSRGVLSASGKSSRTLAGGKQRGVSFGDYIVRFSFSADAS